MMRKVIKKIKIARELGKPVDGHAPGLTGSSLRNILVQG